jgi:hypothetical protein
MIGTSTYTCAICGFDCVLPGAWFLVAASLWEDKLLVFRWNETLARQNGLLTVCTAEHVRDLVAHWMTMGSLGNPFARVHFNSKQNTGPLTGDLDLRGAVQLGEIAVHRESIDQVLGDNPHSLNTIVSALAEALQDLRSVQDLRSIAATPELDKAQFSHLPRTL